MYNYQAQSMSNTKKFRTRQAPSPTGYLHIGTARIVLFTKLIAKINDGVYYLRLDDTDRNRLQPEAVIPLLKTLSSIGLSPDEGITLEEFGEKDEFYGIYQKGEYGPYMQSQRNELYYKHAQNMLDKKLAYWNYLTEQDKQELQELKNLNKRPINYYKINSEKFGEEIYVDVQTGLKDPRKPALMYKIQRDQKVKCYDELLGENEFDLSLEEDLVILKSDSYPTYHLAHLIDDRLMETSLVIRGSQDWYASFARHTTMFMDYYGEVPKYLHVPVILGETGNKKMSKRDGNTNMQDYLNKGYLPEALINYLVFLGWNPGTEKEIYLDQADFDLSDKPLSNTNETRLNTLINNLAADFSIEKISRSPARFNQEKLNWFNRQYIQMMSLEEFTFRAFDLKLQQKMIDQSLRVGDYVYLIDVEKQKVFMNHTLNNPDHVTGDGQFYPIGGGREEGETGIENLIRETDEETYGKIKIDPSKLIKIADFSLAAKEPYEYLGKTWTGKEMHIYFYPISTEDLDEYTLEDNGSWIFKWHNISEVIQTNDFVTYPIWREFCKQHNLPCFEPTEQIKTQYLAWNLDKNRITVLSEFGWESGCILNWQKPLADDLKWKKITTEESLQNLSDILPVVVELSKELSQERLELKNSIFEPNLNEKFLNLATTFETKIKLWLQENQKDTGSYLWPLRVSLSGKLKSPSPFEILAILDTEEVEHRIKSCIK